MVVATDIVLAAKEGGGSLPKEDTSKRLDPRCELLKEDTNSSLLGLSAACEVGIVTVSSLAPSATIKLPPVVENSIALSMTGTLPTVPALVTVATLSGSLGTSSSGPCGVSPPGSSNPEPPWSGAVSGCGVSTAVSSGMGADGFTPLEDALPARVAAALARVFPLRVFLRPANSPAWMTLCS